MDLAGQILDQARAQGATLAGLAAVAALRNSPSTACQGGRAWPPGLPTVLVLALGHPVSAPELDFWGGPGGTPGNRLLVRTARKLQAWLAREHDIQARDIPYHVERGGVFLKDAAALAGLGIIGRNNLLVTPEHGPRIRLRAMFLDRELPPSGPLDFHPCDDCDGPCLAACPVQAFARDGYAKSRCSGQMQRDEANPIPVPAPNPHGMPHLVVSYCRRCELGCVVGLK